MVHRCGSLTEADERCERDATHRVFGRRGWWSGYHCDEHTIRCIGTMGEDNCNVEVLGSEEAQA